MNLDRARLANVLDTLRLACGNKVMEVSYYVKFVIDKENQAVYLTTTDFHTFIAIDFGDVSLTNLEDVPDEFLIKFKSLHDLIKYSTTEDARLVGTDDGRTIEVTTNGTFKFPCYSEISQFPAADFNYESSGEWDVPVLREIWEKVSTVVSKDVTKISYQGVNFDGNWAASDNRRFALVDADEDHPYEGDSMLIPPVFGDILGKMGGSVTIGRNESGNMLILNNVQNGIIAAMRLLDAKFVNYRKVLENRDQLIKLTMPKPILLGALQRMSCVTDKLFKVGSFKLVRNDDGGVSMLCRISHEASTGAEVVPAINYDGELGDNGAEFQYQIDNLADGINAVESNDEVLISFQTDGKLWIDEGDFHYLLSRISS